MNSPSVAYINEGKLSVEIIPFPKSHKKLSTLTTDGIKRTLSPLQINESEILKVPIGPEILINPFFNTVSLQPIEFSTISATSNIPEAENK